MLAQVRAERRPLRTAVPVLYPMEFREKSEIFRGYSMGMHVKSPRNYHGTRRFAW